jgi:hypothetical protein
MYRKFEQPKCTEGDTYTVLTPIVFPSHRTMLWVLKL